MSGGLRTVHARPLLVFSPTKAEVENGQVRPKIFQQSWHQDVSELSVKENSRVIVTESLVQIYQLSMEHP